MKKTFFLAVLVAAAVTTMAQTRYFTRNGRVEFNASSPLEKIEAINEKATSVVDLSNGQIEFSVLMKAFLFERALMQEHFNENYVESDKYPKAVFKGTIENPAAIMLSKDGTYTAKVTGKLTLHGETGDVSAVATFVVKNGALTASAEFKIETADYKIEIPGVVRDKIAKTVMVNVSANYEPLKAS